MTMTVRELLARYATSNELGVAKLGEEPAAALAPGAMLAQEIARIRDRNRRNHRIFVALAAATLVIVLVTILAQAHSVGDGPKITGILGGAGLVGLAALIQRAMREAERAEVIFVLFQTLEPKAINSIAHELAKAL